MRCALVRLATVGFLGGLSALGCAGPRVAAQGAIPKAYTFTCSDGFVVRATFADDTATVVLPDTTLVMQRLISADGGRYGAGNLVFWGKGVSAFLMRNDSIVHRDCARSDSARSDSASEVD